MTMRQITYDETIEHLSWPDAVAALRQGAPSAARKGR